MIWLVRASYPITALQTGAYIRHPWRSSKPT